MQLCSLRGVVLTAAFTSLGLAATAATVDQITSSSFTSTGTIADGVTFTDSDVVTAASGAISSQANDFENLAQGVSTDIGILVGTVEGQVANGENANRGSTVSSITQSETNNSGAAQSYSMDYALVNMALDLNGDQGGASFGVNPLANDQTSAIGAFVDYRIAVNGVDQIAFHAELFGGGGTYQVANLQNLTGSTTGSSVQFDFGFPGQGERLNLDDVFGSLDLGTLQDGESISVVSTLTVGYVGNGFENFMFATFGDPNQIAAGPILAASTPPPAVPLPAAAWLLGLGMASFGVVRRRKSK